MARGNKQRRNASRSTQPRSHNHLDQSMQSTPQDDWEHEQNTESIGSAQQHSSKSGVSFDDEGRDYGSSSRLPLVPPDHPESSSQQHTKSSSSSRRQSKSKPSRVQRKGAGRTSTTPQLATTSQSSQELSGGPKAVARNRFDDVIYTVEFAFAEPGVRLIGGIMVNDEELTIPLNSTQADRIQRFLERHTMVKVRVSFDAETRGD